MPPRLRGSHVGAPGNVGRGVSIPPNGLLSNALLSNDLISNTQPGHAKFPAVVSLDPKRQERLARMKLHSLDRLQL